MTTKQDKLYKNILMEIYNSGIDLNYNGFKLNTLKTKNGGIEDKIKVYHLFFKSFGAFPKEKKLYQLDSKEFNIFIESIRVILSENDYVLKIDNSAFNKAIKESKKVMEFDYFLKR